MKAAVYNSYGKPEVLEITDIPKPIPKDNEVLVKIHAATVTSGDVRLRSSDFPPLFWLPARIIFGLFSPKKRILGHEFSGRVEAVGSAVRNFKVGDDVFGTTTMRPTGSYAEYICLPEQWKQGVLIHKPKELSFQEAAALPVGSMTALFLLNKGGITKGQNVLIYGASGSVGSYAVQLAKIKGANVTGVCSGSNFDMVRSLGADDLIDYKTQDYTNSRETFDMVLDAVGKTNKSQANKVLSAQGHFVTIASLTQENENALKEIASLAAQGKLRPYIDKVFSLDQIVEAHSYVDSGRKRGNVIITVFRE